MDIPESFLVQLQNESDIDLNSVCRLCFSAEAELVPCFAQLHSPESTDLTSLLDLIHACVQLKVTQGDDCPQNLCHTCISSLVAWQEFKKKCHTTNGLLKNWHSRKSQQKNTESNLVETGPTLEAKNKDRYVKKQTDTSARIKMSQHASDNEDYWILVVGDGSSEKVAGPLNCTNITPRQTINDNGNSSKSGNKNSKRQLETNNRSKVVMLPSSSSKKVVKEESNKKNKDVSKIKNLIAQNKYELKNGCIVINSRDLESTRQASDDVIEIRSAGDLFSKTSFSMEDAEDDSMSTVASTPSIFVDKIQKLIDDNDAILKTSAVNVKRAQAVFRTAENELAANSTKSTTVKPQKSTSNSTSTLKKNACNTKPKTETRKRKWPKASPGSQMKQKLAFTCDVCGVKFHDSESLLNHDQTKHLDFPRLFSCNLCGTFFLTEEHVNLHTSTYHKNESDASSQDERGGKIIVRFKDDSDGQHGTLICGICDESFNSMITLKTHLESCENSVLFV